MVYTLYKVTNIINGRFYVGVHKTTNPHDNYLGSGQLIKKAIKKYGKNNFKKDILATFIVPEEAYQAERVLIQEHLSDPLCYNIHHGGKGGWDHWNKNKPAGFVNPMHVPNIADRQRAAAKATKMRNKKHYDDLSTINLSKTWDSNRGKSRPDHSRLMKDITPMNDPAFQQKLKEARRAKARKIVLEDPKGNKHGPNTAFELHHLVGIGCPTLTGKSEGDVIKKGNFKGWKLAKVYDES